MVTAARRVSASLLVLLALVSPAKAVNNKVQMQSVLNQNIFTNGQNYITAQILNNVMTQMIASGTTFTGAWNSGNTYTYGDYVTYNGSVWIAIAPVVGTPPAAGAWLTTSASINSTLALDGSGNIGINFASVNTWTATQTFATLNAASIVESGLGTGIVTASAGTLGSFTPGTGVQSALAQPINSANGMIVPSGIVSGTCTNGLSLNSSGAVVSTACPGAASTIQAGGTAVTGATASNYLLTTGTVSGGNGTLTNVQPIGGTAITITVTGSTATWSTNGVLLASQYFIASGTYTPTTGTHVAYVECAGGGGGGGGAAANSGATASAGAGGGAGERRVYTYVSPTTQTVTIGGGGAGGVGTTGSPGGDTTFGALLTAKHGSGGGSAQSTGVITPLPGAGGFGGSGGDTNGAYTGSPGGLALISQPAATGGAGGMSIFGAGGIPTNGTNNGNVGGIAAGGGGASSLASGGTQTTGGAGGGGYCHMEDFG